MNSLKVNQISYKQLDLFIKNEVKNRKLPDFDDLLYTEPHADLHENIFGIFIGAKIIGYVTTAKVNNNHCDKLYISPDYRGKGVATFVLNFLEITSIFVLEQNTKAVDLYKRVGFKIVAKHHSMLTMTRDFIDIPPIQQPPKFTQW